MQMAEQRNINRLITYGKDENCDVWGEVISCAPFLKFLVCAVHRLGKSAEN